MSPKSPQAAPQEAGSVTHGKGLDALDRFIIQNWPPSARFGIWHGPFSALMKPRTSLEHFLNDTLKAGWERDGLGAVITIEPPREPLVLLSVTYENKHWTPESKYHPKHWVWGVVPPAQALGRLEATLGLELPEAEAAYLRGLREGILKGEWDGFLASPRG